MLFRQDGAWFAGCNPRGHLWDRLEDSRQAIHLSGDKMLQLTNDQIHFFCVHGYLSLYIVDRAKVLVQEQGESFFIPAMGCKIKLANGKCF
jgi:hypothetical protein